MNPTPLTVGSMMVWLTMPSYSSESSFRWGPSSVFPLRPLDDDPSAQLPLVAKQSSLSSEAAAAAVALQSVRRSGSFTLRILIARFPDFS